MKTGKARLVTQRLSAFLSARFLALLAGRYYSLRRTLPALTETKGSGNNKDCTEKGSDAPRELMMETAMMMLLEMTRSDKRASCAMVSPSQRWSHKRSV